MCVSHKCVRLDDQEVRAFAVKAPPPGQFLKEICKQAVGPANPAPKNWVDEVTPGDEEAWKKKHAWTEDDEPPNPK